MFCYNKIIMYLCVVIKKLMFNLKNEANEWGT